MQLCWQLQKVLADHNLDVHGVLLRISRSAKIHRSIVSNIYKDKASTVSLETLSKLCGWLHDNGVPENLLPGALIGQRPSDLS
jgi:DNA-binding Xre family transcriptional regulator